MVYQFPRAFGAAAVLLLLTGCGSAGVPQEATAIPAGVGATAVALIASTPTQPATTIPTATASSAAASTTAPEPPSATPEPPSATPEPTATLVPPQASSFPNGQTNPYSTGLDAFQTNASDPSVGENDGDGIESVNFEVVLNGAGAVYSTREERAPFCAFGDDGINCNPYDFAANANKWPDGTPIANGQYTLVVVTRATSGASKREELPFAIQLAPDAPAPAPVPPAPVRAVDCSRSSLPSDNPTTITFINQSGRIASILGGLLRPRTSI